MRRTVPLLFLLLLGACTSLGHGGREAPKIERQTGPIREVGLDVDNNELAVAMESLLDAHGVKGRLLASPQVSVMRGEKEYTYDEVQTRYVLRVRSKDRDSCVPSGGRQMDFHISVVDFQERRRVFLMNGDHGCKDSILQRFGNWLAAVAPADSTRAP